MDGLDIVSELTAKVVDIVWKGGDYIVFGGMSEYSKNFDLVTAPKRTECSYATVPYLNRS